VFGPTLPSRTGEFRVNPARCDHPLDMLKGMGGTKSAITCEMCGGRWEKGPAGDMILGALRKRTLVRVKTETYEEVFGAFLAPGVRVKTEPYEGVPPSAATGATPKAPSRVSPSSSRKESQEQEMRRMMMEMKKELDGRKKRDERQRKTRSRASNEDYVMADEGERTGPLDWETDSSLSR